MSPRGLPFVGYLWESRGPPKFPYRNFLVSSVGLPPDLLLLTSSIHLPPDLLLLTSSV